MSAAVAVRWSAQVHSVIVAAASGTSAVLGALRLKIVAQQTGPSGLGGVTIALNATWTLAIVLGLGLATSAAARLASAVGDADRLLVVDAALRLSTRVMMAVGGLLSIGFWSLFAPSGGAHRVVAAMSLGVAVSSIIASNRLLAWLAATQRIRALAATQVSSAILATVALWLVRAAGPDVILCVAVSGPALGLLVSAILCRPVARRAGPEHWRGVRAVLDDLRWMVATGAAASTSPLVLTLTQLVGAMWLARRFSLETAGDFQASASVATAVLTVVMASLNAVYLPRLSAPSASQPALVHSEARKTAVLLGLTVTALSLVAPMLLSLLYAPQFSENAGEFRWFMLGMILKAFSWIFAYPLLSAGRSARFALLELLWAGTYLLLLTVLAGAIGSGPGLAYAIAGAASLVLALIVTHRVPRRDALVSMTASAASLLLIALSG